MHAGNQDVFLVHWAFTALMEEGYMTACDTLLLMSVHVEPPPPGSPQLPAPESKAKPRQAPQVSDSRCEPPKLVPGTNDTFLSICLSPGIPLAPGQVSHT
jgi:hypothetical protein